METFTGKRGRVGGGGDCDITKERSSRTGKGEYNLSCHAYVQGCVCTALQLMCRHLNHVQPARVYVSISLRVYQVNRSLPAQCTSYSWP